MKLASVVCLFAFPIVAIGTIDNATLQELGRVAYDRTGKAAGHIIEVHQNAQKDPKELVDGLRKMFHPRSDAVIIYCRYPGVAAPIIREAFASFKRSSLKGFTVICAIKERRNPALEAAAARSGATLYLEAVP